MSTEAHKKTSFIFQHLRGERECEQERENYKQTETGRREEKESKKETVVLREAWPVRSLSNSKISERLPDGERKRAHRQLVPTPTWVMVPKWSSHKPAC